MSRIHEALKKAEQERAATEAPFSPVPVEESPVFADMLDRPAPGNDMPIFAGQISLEALLAGCTRSEWKPDLQTMLFMNGNEGARGTEEYRTLRSRLYHLREKMPLKTILVTSALPGEGKSFTAANLAQVMVRQHGKRALLIDGDLRGPRLHQMLGTPAGPGLSEYLLGKADELSIIRYGAMENLFFIPSGTSIEDPSELVGSAKLKGLLQRLEPLFDWIIVDSPPAVAVSDASMLAKACDGVLIVVRSNSTPSDVARKARMEFPEQVLVGVVLNGTETAPPSYERYYYEAYGKKTT